MVVLCTVSIMLSNNYRLVEELYGKELKESIDIKTATDYLYVDFEVELKKRKFKLRDDYTYVQKVNSNNCLYLKSLSNK